MLDVSTINTSIRIDYLSIWILVSGGILSPPLSFWMILYYREIFTIIQLWFCKHFLSLSVYILCTCLTFFACQTQWYFVFTHLSKLKVVILQPATSSTRLPEGKTTTTVTNKCQNQ